MRSAVPGAAVVEQELCKPDAALSAARSFAGRELADAAVELELPGARLVRLELMAAHSRLPEAQQEHSPPAVPHAGLPALQEPLAAQQLSRGLPVAAALPELPGAVSSRLAARELETSALRPEAQLALLLEQAEELRDAVAREAAQLPAAAFL